MIWWVRVGGEQMPFDLGKWDLSKVPLPELEGHLLDAIVS
jgi:hypothetical protein